MVGSVKTENPRKWVEPLLGVDLICNIVQNGQKLEEMNKTLVQPILLMLNESIHPL